MPTFADWRFDEEQYCRREQVRPLDLTPDALFGFFAVFAVAVEASGQVGQVVRGVKKSQLAAFNLLRWSSIAHHTESHFDLVQGEITRCGFTQEQQDFVWRWARGKIKLVDSEPEQ